MQYDEFERDLIDLTPRLRALAVALTRDRQQADDLVQDALLKALRCRSQYTPGTNLKAWAYCILRNVFLSEKRRSWRAVQLDPEVAEQTLVAHGNADARLELEDVRQALHLLPLEQREAIVLVAAAGLSYEEVAEICGCAVGTIKSRVSRARDALERMIYEGERPAAEARPPVDADAWIATEVAQVAA